MPRLRAELPSRAYDVVVADGALDGVGDAVASLRPGVQAVVCTDENVAPLYLDRVHVALREAGLLVSQLVVPAGEAEKNLDRAAEMYGVLYDRGIRRRDVVVALGGGVIGDLAGYVAATFLRGVGLVQVPTTLLAQVDAAIGGKVAVDFRSGKNYVGTFYQPLLVVADPLALRTLPPREVRSGAAEVVKYGFLAGGDLLDAVDALARAARGGKDESGGGRDGGGQGEGVGGRVSGGQGEGVGRDGGDALVCGIGEEVIAACVAQKLAVVARDEREETGARAVLNLGHTIGHAIEAATAFRRYTHGEAVGLGLRAALWLSERLCGLSGAEVERGLGVLDDIGLPVRLRGARPDDVRDLVARDKKAGAGGVRGAEAGAGGVRGAGGEAAAGGVGFVLLEGFGRPRLHVDVPAVVLEEVIAWLSAE